MRNREIEKIDRMERQMSRGTVQERIHYETVREMFRRHPDLRFDETLGEGLANFSDEEIGDIAHMVTLDVFLQDHPDAPIAATKDGERLIPLATMKAFMAWGMAHGQIPEEKRDRVRVLLSTTDEDEMVDLLVFYLGLEGEVVV